MRLVSNRGNTTGPNPMRENSPAYILETLQKGFYVKIDVTVVDKVIFLGAYFTVNLDFIQNEKIICQASDGLTLHFLMSNQIHCFFQQKDNYSITTQGWIWTYPENILTPLSICVMPEWFLKDVQEASKLKCYGICSNYIEYIPKPYVPPLETISEYFEKI